MIDTYIGMHGMFFSASRSFTISCTHHSYVTIRWNATIAKTSL